MNGFKSFDDFFKETPINEKKKKYSKKPKEKVSQKKRDRLARETMNNELKEKITETMQLLHDNDIPLPLMHVTSSAIKTETDIIPTGFIESIKKNGFKARDTNVSGFVTRKTKTTIAEPKDYLNKPENFIKEISLILERYRKHGTRTNKDILGKKRSTGKGIPAMIILSAENVKIEKGSDFDNHFKLQTNISPNNIIGRINIEKHLDSWSKDDLQFITKKLLSNLSKYYKSKNK